MCRGARYHQEYTEEELRELIEKLAKKWFDISGEEAIRIIVSRQWKSQPRFAKWASLDSLVCLLPEARRTGPGRAQI